MTQVNPSERILLDTNVLSALKNPRRHPRVAVVIAQYPARSIFTSVLCLGEMQRGLHAKAMRSPSGVHALERWVAEAEVRFGERVLSIDLEVAKVWGQMTWDRSRPVVDALLAATAVVHGLTLLTRNTRDFDGLPVKVGNPWED